ncbi:MAG TPA: hypothetical protein PKM25_09910, partial [Candidatus Ozemobacteraceae bacterium]|nr:hypothetical protein [Candidatus Ozemobacteraceae bacterium]
MPDHIFYKIHIDFRLRSGVVAILSAILLLISPTMPASAWPPDIQLIVTGNLAGNVASWSQDGEFSPTGAWGVAELIRKLRRERRFASLVIGVGNDSALTSPVTVAGGGAIERAWGKDCNVEIQALGPGDLIACRMNDALPAALMTRIWTNVERADAERVFPGWASTRISGCRINLASLISPSLLADVPLFRWHDLRVEDPLRALHRMRSQAPEADLTILVCHLDAPDSARIMAAAHPTDLLLQVPAAGRPFDLAAHEQPNGKTPETHMIPDGTKALLIIRRFAREAGQTDIQTRRLPLHALRNVPAGPHMAAAISAASSGLHTPLHVMNTSEFPDAPPYFASPEAHAGLVCAVTRADVALITSETDGCFHERVITPLSVFSAFKNRRVRLYNLAGHALRE